MPTFVFSYRRPTDYEFSAESLSAWTSWFDSMGDRLIDLGKPVSEVATIGNHDSAHIQLGGYSIVSADDLESAVAIAKGCPLMDRDGGVEIGQLAEVPGAAD